MSIQRKIPFSNRSVEHMVIDLIVGIDWLQTIAKVFLQHNDGKFSFVFKVIVIYKTNASKRRIDDVEEFMG